MFQKKSNREEQKNFRIWLDSEFGKIPIIIEDVGVVDGDTPQQSKLKIKYHLDWEHKNFPIAIKNLDEDRSNELMTVIRVAIHKVFTDAFEKERKEKE